MRLKDVTRLGNGLFLLGIALVVVAMFVPSVVRAFFALAGLGTAVVGMVLFVALWKCPSCGGSLPSRGTAKIEKCPLCGHNLENEF